MLADSEAITPEFSVVHIEVSDSSEVTLLDEFIDVWGFDPNKGIVDAAVTAEGEQVLRDFGFRYEVDEKLTEKYNRPFDRLKNQTEGIPGYPCYRTVEETLAAGAALAAAYPDLAEWIDIGDSWEKTEPGGHAGYDLMVLRLTNTTNGIPSADKPEPLGDGRHPRPRATSPRKPSPASPSTCSANYGLDPDVTWLLDHHEIHLLLVDQSRRPQEGGNRTSSWRKNTNENYCSPTSSDRGADLNRNLRLRLGSRDAELPCGETYRRPVRRV